MQGAHSVVYRVDLDGRSAVARRSGRSADSLAWEHRLLAHLARHGMRVPAPVPTLDGRLHVDGVMLSPFFDGDPPASIDDWRLIARTLRRVHELTRDWPQRPGAVSLSELTGRSVGVDVSPLPADVRDLCRRCWAPLAGRPRSVIHADPHAGNLLVDGDQVALLDWDEASVDASILDLAALPVGAADVPAWARRAADAYEVAAVWDWEPEYARRRLAQLRRDLGEAP